MLKAAAHLLDDRLLVSNTLCFSATLLERFCPSLFMGFLIPLQQHLQGAGGAVSVGHGAVGHPARSGQQMLKGWLIGILTKTQPSDHGGTAQLLANAVEPFLGEMTVELGILAL
ncbi:hypothetical protein OU995_21660 [Roseateles sp. SL47]|uniref:hypothetical protein n=1 Tax=Roseateles sp. SL47 TaxID=2995138 RepID=UPI00227012A2|nr:hypothetical protein [Roseateles sp. SL47]WAC72143.1 hypothetical protein OU995_21660 [Roseateles sp. SL47]